LRAVNRRAIQLRMIFSLVGEGGIEGEGRRQDDGEKIEPRVVVVSADDRDQVDQGMGDEEGGTRDGGRPVSRPPGPCCEREAGDKERHADVLDEMRVERPGSGRAGNIGVPELTGDQHRQSIETGSVSREFLLSNAA